MLHTIIDEAWIASLSLFPDSQGGKIFFGIGAIGFLIGEAILFHIAQILMQFHRLVKNDLTFGEGINPLIAGGTGNPYFTTDSGAALRALEIGADALLKGTRVDGVYTADPEKDPTAVKYEELSFDKAIEDRLKVMDQTAFALCREGNMPIIVFDMNQKGNLAKLVKGEKVGTLVHV